MSQDRFNGRPPVGDTPEYREWLAGISSNDPNYRASCVEELAKIKNTSVYHAEKILEKEEEGYEFSQGLHDLLSRRVELPEAITNPAEILPPKARLLVENTCRQSAIGTGSVTYALLTAASSMLGSFVMVKTRQNNSAPLPAHLNTVICGRSSDSKSAPLTNLFEPFYLAQRNEERYFEQVLKSLKTPAKENPQVSQDKIEQHKSSRKQRIKYVRSYSAEGLVGDVVKQSPRWGFFIYFDEGRCLKGSQRYGKGGDGTVDVFKQSILEGHNVPLSGSAFIRVKDEDHRNFNYQTISTLVNLQYGVFQDVFNFDYDAEGWLTRFVFISIPEAEEKLSREARRSSGGVNGFNSYIDNLFAFTDAIKHQTPSKTIKISGFEDFYFDHELPKEPDPLTLLFSDEAQTRYEDCLEQCDQLIKAIHKQLGCSASVDVCLVAKLKKVGIYLGKYALILHLLDSAEQSADNPKDAYNKINTPISLRTLERAERLWWFDVSQFQVVKTKSAEAKWGQEEQNQKDLHEQQMKYVLNRIQEKKTIGRSALKESLNGVGGMKRGTVEAIIQTLESLECVKTVYPANKAKNYKGDLVFLKPLRA